MKRTLLVFAALAAVTSSLACNKPQEKTGEPVAADNTQKNERDRENTMLPTDQGGSEADRDITARVRKDVVADDKLSMQAKNVKIITKDGAVTLRGVVKSSAERELVASYAKKAAGVNAVNDQLEIAAN